MSDLEAGIGGGLELGPISLKAIIDLQGSMASVEKAFSEWKQQEADYEYGTTDQAVGANGAANANGFLVLDLGGPSQEFFWEIRQLVVSNIVPTTSVTGTAYAYTAASPPSVNDIAVAPTISNLTDIFATVPLAHFYSTRQFVLHAPEHLYVLFAGAANGALLGAFGTAVQSVDRRRRSIIEL